MGAGLLAGSAFGIANAGGISDELGLSGKQGEYFQPDFSNKALEILQNRNQIYSNANSQPLSDAIRLMQEKGGDIEGTLKEKGMGGEAQDALRDALATGSTTGSLFASRELMNNPILGALFGKSGQLSSTIDDVNRLQSQGFKLQPEDMEAYGQTSGDIARLFGQQEQGVAQDLASRGLAAAPSGAAGALYSGLAGNKNEQLARAQMDIAQRRMQDTLKRLDSARAYAAQLGGLGAGALQQQYERQLAGAREKRGGLETTAELQNSMNAARAGAEQSSVADKRAAKAPSLGEAFGAGLLSSAGQIGASPGTGATAFSKSFGSSLGSMGAGSMMGGGGAAGGSSGGGSGNEPVYYNNRRVS
jgi:hypothetical protein